MWSFVMHAWTVLVQCLVYEILFAVLAVLIMLRGTLFLQPFWIVKEWISGFRHRKN
ncbi:MAG: hypothetical protein ABF449_07545 [Ethanoligenens sp.]|uniref:hypothetical protein n=1 Tax=Ethanoligenens sp. TaxID=2099655 RepID=UPI0039E92199